MEVVLADPNFYNNYIALKTAFVGLMGEDRTDFLLTNRVSKLREKDRIRSTEEIEKQAEVTEQISKEQQLVNKLKGFVFDPYSGDIWNPKNFRKSDFKTPGSFESAQEFGGVTINIENVNGLDPEEISRALSDELNSKLSL